MSDIHHSELEAYNYSVSEGKEDFSASVPPSRLAPWHLTLALRY